MSSLYEQIIADKKKSIIRNGESFQESRMYCPYCAHADNDFHEYLSDIAENEEEVRCENCDKDFMVKWESVISTRKLK